MKNLPIIAEQMHDQFEAITQARDKALIQSRQMIRNSAHAIRAIHRSEKEEALKNINKAHQLLLTLKKDLSDYPSLFHAGYTQDAIKEYAEASITYALIVDQELPTPESLEIDGSAYLNGLAETVGELRRRCLDILRQGYSQDAERLLSAMDEIYSVLVTMDYPDAITHGLRRKTDLVRGILERTRGDLTISLREEQLKKDMENLLEKLQQSNNQD